MKTFKLLLSTVICFIVSVISFSDSKAVMYIINNTINGAQCVPPIVTNGTGTITGTYNDVSNSLSFTINFSGLTGFTTVAHFHGPATATQNAGVIIGYTGFPTGVQSGTYSNTYILTAAQETQLLGNLWYSNIHTTTVAGGEIRGQIYPIAVSNLNITALIQGFYNDGTNLMVPDVITANIRQSTSPYTLVSSKNINLNNAGNGNADYTGVSNGTNYYLQILHRNSIETWSMPASFTSNALSYDFTTSASQAFGDNLKLKGTKYCNYNGDVNQDGIIEGSDASLVDNAASEFLTGYVDEDCDGNDFVDGSDGSIVDNNASEFVTAITP